MVNFRGFLDAIKGVVNTKLTEDNKLAKECAITLLQNLSSIPKGTTSKEGPKKVLNHPGLIDAIHDIISEEASEMNKVSRKNALLCCQNLSFPADLRAKLFQATGGKFFEALVATASDLTNPHNEITSVKAMLVIANMANKKEVSSI